MGLDTPSVMFLCAAKKMGADFTSTAMIGRQIFFSNPTVVARVLSALGVDENASDFVRVANNQFAEPYYRLLGATSITSVDYSAYESASVLHDMNTPIPDSLRGRFSVVHDGGTLEHVFDVAQALKNCMEMVKLNGHFIQVTCANNYMGHGFWQFSPEVIFRAFVPENGFEVKAVLVHEVVPGGSWYAVSDPEQVKSRVELCNGNQTYILTLAQRIETTEIFRVLPQQSDYVALWEANGDSQQTIWREGQISLSSRAFSAARMPLRLLPRPVKRILRTGWKKLLPGPRKSIHGFNRPYYHRITEEQLLAGQLS